MGIASIIIGIVFLLIMGGLGSWLAEKKGYSSGSWFFLCLLTGPIGLLTLAGAPNQKIEPYLDLISRKLDTQVADKASSSAPIISSPPVRSSGESWFCKKCQTENPATVNSCKGCGEYR